MVCPVPSVPVFRDALAHVHGDAPAAPQWHLAAKLVGALPLYLLDADGDILLVRFARVWPEGVPIVRRELDDDVLQGRRGLATHDVSHDSPRTVR